MERHLVITADSHAGPLVPAYRAYLDPRYREELDAFVAQQKLDPRARQQEQFDVVTR